jgi:hypothetical protein
LLCGDLRLGANDVNVIVCGVVHASDDCNQ